MTGLRGRRSRGQGSEWFVAMLVAGITTGAWTDGRLAAQEAPTPTIQDEEIEARGRELIREFGLVAYPKTRAVLLPPACEGFSLFDCFGGEERCTLGGLCTANAVAGDRAQLVQRLDALDRASTHHWVVGQRVHWALKNGDVLRARAISEQCGAELWWCQALRGYALHEADRASGEAQFDSALVNAPPGTLAWIQPGDPANQEWSSGPLVCEWTDLRLILEGELRDEYERLPCGGRSEFEARFWWLADPLWSVAGNARRAAHIARIMQMRLHDELGEDEGAHTWRHHQAIMPSGVPNSWRTLITYDRDGRQIEKKEAYVNSGYSFTPDARSYANPLATASRDWFVDDGDGHERMVTLEAWYNVEHAQSAMLRRGDRFLVVAAARLPLVVSDFAGVSGSLAMGRPADLHLEVAPAVVDQFGVLRALMDVDDGEWMASIEMLGPKWRARARHGLAAPSLRDGFGISAPLLVDERFESDSLSLMSAMLPTSVLSGRSQMGLYFEIYGTTTDQPLRMALSVEPTSRSLFRRLAGTVGLGMDVPIEMSWEEPAATLRPDLTSRYLTLDLAGLQEGEHRLTLKVERPNGAVVSSSRVIVIGPR